MSRICCVNSQDLRLTFFALGFLIFSGCTSSPILGLIESEDIAEIKQFYSGGRDPNAIVANGGTTPLLYAFRMEKKQSFTALLESGADPNAMCGDSLSIMHYSVASPDAFWLKEAIRFNGNPNLWNSAASNFRKGSVLWFAIRYNQVENVNLLLDAGAELDGIVHNGMTPLASSLKDSFLKLPYYYLNEAQTAPLLEKNQIRLYFILNRNSSY